MKQALLIFSLLSITLFNVGCTEEPDSIGLAGTYVGQMNVGSTNFQHVSYTVTVTETGTSTVQITPNTSDATSWTSTLMNIAGVYTCVSCTANQITFTPINGNMQLSYNYDGDEQFTGTKQ